MTKDIDEMIEQVEELSANTPDGTVIDADTILVDLVENCDLDCTGFAQDIFMIYQRSTDKQAVKEMFFEFTGVEFEDYLQKCIDETTRPEEYQLWQKIEKHRVCIIFALDSAKKAERQIMSIIAKDAISICRGQKCGT